MAIRCPCCKKEYDVTLFEFEKTINCDCGNVISLQHKEIFRALLNARKDVNTTRFREEEKILEIKISADKIAFLIVSTDYPKIDIEIEKEKFRERINELFPDKAHLYELIYEPRFRRLEEQFRNV
jgi:hypothetical protein